MTCDRFAVSDCCDASLIYLSDGRFHTTENAASPFTALYGATGEIENVDVNYLTSHVYGEGNGHLYRWEIADIPNTAPSPDVWRVVDGEQLTTNALEHFPGGSGVGRPQAIDVVHQQNLIYIAGSDNLFTTNTKVYTVPIDGPYDNPTLIIDTLSRPLVMLVDVTTGNIWLHKYSITTGVPGSIIYRLQVFDSAGVELHSVFNGRTTGSVIHPSMRMLYRDYDNDRILSYRRESAGIPGPTGAYAIDPVTFAETHLPGATAPFGYSHKDQAIVQNGTTPGRIRLISQENSGDVLTAT